MKLLLISLLIIAATFPLFANGVQSYWPAPLPTAPAPTPGLQMGGHRERPVHLVLDSDTAKGRLSSLNSARLPHVGTAAGWVTIISENFEGAFPGAWAVSDNAPEYGEYYWGKRNCRPYGGSYSGWAVGAGADGLSLSCGQNYPDYTFSWMIYGPFSLADATAADLTFKLWLNSELDYDKVFWGASINGEDFYGVSSSGNTNGWADKALDLNDVYTLGSLLGRSQVWIALVFSSDVDTNYSEGAYVDNIVLRKYVPTTAPTNTPTPTPTRTPTRTPTPIRTPTRTSTPGPPRGRVYLPVMWKGYPPLLITNGGFETGDFSGWQQGGELGRRVAADVVHSGRYAALLGNPEAAPCSAPVGQAWLEQEFMVPATGTPRLSLWYRLFTYDRNRNLEDGFDRFDVLLNGEYIGKDANRDMDPKCSGDPHDLGWREFVYDLSARRGQWVLLRIVLTRRYPEYNTWVYVDDVRVGLQ